MNCAVEIDEGGVAVGFGVVQNALHACIFTKPILRVFKIEFRRYWWLPVTKCALDREGVNFKFCSKNTGFVSLSS